jgi:hypothetical protein
MERVRFQLFLFTSILAAAYDQALRVKMRAFSKGTALVFRTKWILLSFLMIALCASTAMAQGTYTAASCNESDVNAVINGPTHTAVNGDTINIPAGSCTWTSVLTVPSGIGISIIGAGTPNTGTGTVGAGTSTTTITDDVTSGHLMVFRPTYGNSLTRLSLMNILPYSGATLSNPIIIIGTCTSSGCPNMRVDNLTFPSSWESGGIPDASMINMDDMFGVVDHNTLTATSGYMVLVNVNHSAWQGLGAYGDNSWASPDTFGTAQALYVENNALTNGDATDTDGADTFTDTSGGRFVCRYNTFYSISSIAPACSNHGTESGGRMRGGRQMEAYNNTLICTKTSGCPAAFGSRSGAVLIYNNTVTAEAGTFFSNFLVPSLLRSTRGPMIPWGNCDGTGQWDLNDGTIYGTGTVTTSGQTTFSDSNATWTLNEWAGSAITNGVPYSIHDVTQSFGDEITANTTAPVQYTFIGPPANIGDTAYYTWNTGDSYQILRATVCIDQPGRGQTSVNLAGSGCGSSAATPTCVGWVGNALDPIYEWGDTYTGSVNGNWISSTASNRLLNNRDFYEQCGSKNPSCTGGFTGAYGTGSGLHSAIPFTCTTGVAYWATDQSTLYKCTATNTWTAFYQPYTYPHPLTACSASSSSPAPPCGLTATAVPAQ